MFDRLNTTPAPKNVPPLGLAPYSKEVRGRPAFPVSRFRETLPGNEEWAGRPHQSWIFPVSRFTRFEIGAAPVGAGEWETFRA